MNFKSRVVVISGAASGIGRAIALNMAAQGAKLALVDVDQENLTAVVAEVEKAGSPEVYSQVLDVTQAQQWTEFAAAVKTALGNADVVFNNAGIARSGTFEEIETADFEAVMNVNYWGMVFGTRAFLPQVKLRQGSFVNVSSLFGLIGVYGQAAYCSSKFAIRGFNESIRQEFAKFGVHVVSVHPGGIKTNIAKNALEHEGNENAEELNKKAQETMLVMPPEKAAEIIIKGLGRRQARVLVGNDAKFMSFVQRCMPAGYPEFMELLLSFKKADLVEDEAPQAVLAHLKKPSLRSRFITWVLKNQFKKKMVANGNSWDPEKLRSLLEKSAMKTPPKGIVTEDVHAATADNRIVKGEWQYDSNQQTDHTILYLHGGGYVFCSVATHRAMTTAWAREAKAKVFSVDYRLAPENLYPAALEDALAAYQWLLENGTEANKIIIAGDSAGGGLGLALLLKLKAEGLPQPAAAVLLSPWTDLAGTGASLDANEKSCAMFTGDMIRDGANYYTADQDKTNPFISPLYGELDGLAPMRIYVSNSEVLTDDSLRFYDKAEQAGVDAQLRVWADQPHVWPVFYGKIPEAKQTVEEMAEYSREKTSSEK